MLLVDEFCLVPGVVLFANLSSLIFAMMFSVGAASAEVDFEKDVLPIFRQHCFQCHSGENTEGELSLESVSAIRRGGHTGNPMLAAALKESELYLRIVSRSSGYRMPKEGDPLSQENIDVIATWVRQTAESTSNQPAANEAPPSFRANAAASANGTSLLEGMDQSQVTMLVVSSALLLCLAAWLLFRFIAKARRKGKFTTNHTRWEAACFIFIGALSLFALVAAGYFYSRNGELVKENESLRAELQAVQPVLIAPEIRIDADNLPLAPHPLHPPRLGGRYYRGNDERSASLFNQGFYRTATIDLHLVNSAGERLKYEDSIDGDLSIEIVIERAPKATKELFSQRVLDSIAIEHFSQSVPRFKRSDKFTAVEKEDLWKAVIPLPSRDRWKSKRGRGMVYMMYGVQPGENRFPRPHFAIRYDVQLDGQKISADSELWMGSMYTLGNRVMIPDEKKILLDRWFDWRPIPVIEGEAATDPKLLGIEEHVKQ